MANSQSCVLVLDADEATRTLYERTLREHWQLIGSASESDALAIIENSHVDVLVVEPTTLKDEGWNFLTRVRSRHATLPIVVCSTLDARRQGVRQGVAAYLIKPVSPQQLATVLREVLAIASASQRVIEEAASTENPER